MALDDLTPDAFVRLSALEQSQELLRRAQFLDMSSRARHAATLEYHEEWLVQHQAQLDAHARSMIHLQEMLDRQQELQAQVNELQAKMDARIDDHAGRLSQHDAVMAQLQLILEAILALLRGGNGHGGHTP